MDALKHKIGRPLRWQTPDELRAVLQEYLDNTPEDELTVTGMALELCASKQVLAQYEKRPGYSEIIREAKLLVENAYERDLRRKGRSGDIFALKNFGWKDTQEQVVTITEGGPKSLEDVRERMKGAEQAGEALVSE
jgi:hypothetical protein